MRLPKAFYSRPAPQLAPALLGMHLVRPLPDGTLLRARIVETEAYQGEDDSACHARTGRSARNFVMFGEPGRAYVYLIYGMYDMLNISADLEGCPAAVLIRAVEPLEGLSEMQARRAVSGIQLTNGPGKLCRAMGIDRSLNDTDLVDGTQLWLEQGEPLTRDELVCGPRVGIDYAAPEHRDLPWRFVVRGNRWVSRR